MTQPDPRFDALHPSGHILARSCRGGYLHSVALTEGAMDADAQSLADAIRLTADVSHLSAVVDVRREILAAGHTPSDDVPGENEFSAAAALLSADRLQPRDREH